MVHEFRLPDVGEGVSEGELISWLVEEGDPVTEDQPVAEVETDKALVEIPSPINGTVHELHFEPGDIMPVGDVFITFDVDGEVGEAEPSPSEEVEPSPADTSGRVFASPSVRRLARELDVDLSTVDGTGPGGRVTETDVQAAASEDTTPTEVEVGAADTTPAEPSRHEPTAEREQTLAAPATRRLAREQGVDINAVPASETVDGEAFVTPEDVESFAAGAVETAEPASPTPTESIPYRGVRRTIGEQMERSVYTAPHVTHHELIEVDGLVETREALKPVAEEQGIKLTYLPFVIKALIASLKAHPKLNAELDEENEEIILKQYYNIGIAVATDVGLMVPVLKDTDEKDMLQLASESRELAQKARDREVSPDELKGSTITITNFGAIGGDYATPVINFPEVAILGLGELKQRPVVVDGEVEARYTLPLSITIDHRVIDGAEVAEFAATLGRYLSDPRTLLLG